MIKTVHFFSFIFNFRFPNVAQELICHSSMIAQALVEGGWAKEEEDDKKEGSDGEGSDDADAPVPPIKV